MTDIQSFASEIMEFLTEEDILDLEEKAGVRFPLDLHADLDLCYICCWLGMYRELPHNLHNRMIIGEVNDWSRLYVRVLDEKRRNGTHATTSIEELFNLAG
jgi:hypothetical protein